MDDLFQNTAYAPDFTKHGAVRHRNGVQQRNFHGFYQYCETDKDNWMFVIYAFGDIECSVYKVESEDGLCLAIVPIDSHNRISICGRKIWSGALAPLGTPLEISYNLRILCNKRKLRILEKGILYE